MNWCMAHITDFTQEQYDAVYDTMTPSRKAHIDTFRHPGAKRQSLAGELLLRRLLEEQGIHAAIERLSSGEPVLRESNFHVSIAHCDEYVVCALSRKRVGIDIEKTGPVKPGMVQKVCTPEELQYVRGDEMRFFEIWTAKEAFFKMQGTGITNFQAVNTLGLNRKLFRHGDYWIQIVYEE